MFRFIETIHLDHGRALNLPLHQHRVESTFKRFFPGYEAFDLESLFLEGVIPASGKFRCTLNYDEKPAEMKVIPYVPKSIQRLIIKNGDEIEYGYKYADRSGLNRLLEGLQPEEEVIIVKNDYITDASYANLVFFDGISWITPSSFLLNGIKRQLLLKKGILREKDIRVKDLSRYKKCSLINALLDQGEIVIDLSKIKDTYR